MRTIFIPSFSLANVVLLCLSPLAIAANETAVVEWNFNTEQIHPTAGAGDLSLIGGVVQDGFSSGFNRIAQEQDSSLSALQTRNYPEQETGDRTAGLEVMVDVSGYSEIVVDYDHRVSGTSAGHVAFLVTGDGGANWTEIETVSLGPPHNTWYSQRFDLSGFSGMSDNPAFGFRLVAAFSPDGFERSEETGTVTYAADTAYRSNRVDGDYDPNGAWRFDNIRVLGVAVEGTPNGPTVRINEIMASNGGTLADEDGDFEDWIELHNFGEESVNLSGIGLSDDFDNAFRWVLPEIHLGPGEFLLVWASGKDRRAPGGELHTNFSIASSGEEILLTAPDGSRIDELPPTNIPRDISLGRSPDGTGDWFFFSETTPGASNETTAYRKILDPPSLSHGPGFYNEAFPLTLTHADGDAVLRYTLDGSEPTVDSPEFPVSLIVDSRENQPNTFSATDTTAGDSAPWHEPDHPVFKATTLRVAAFADEAISSRPITGTFFVGPDVAERYTMPVISVVTEREHFFGHEDGIYVAGAGYANGNHWQDSNFWQRGREWERPIHLEIFESDGALALAQDAGARIHGGWSRRFAFKSLRFYARNDYGNNHFNYRLFPEKSDDSYKRFMIRNSGNDHNLTLFRDAFMQRFVGHMQFDTQAYRPAVIFINGEYWGIKNIRERYDRFYLARTHGIDPDNIDLLDGEWVSGQHVAKEGDTSHYNAMVQYIETHGVSDQEHYEHVGRQMDFGNFIDYNIAQIYLNNVDWPGNNIDFWRVQTDGFLENAPYGHDGRWRWMLFDTDFGFWMNHGDGPDHDMLRYATGADGQIWQNPDWATFLLRELLENETFRHRFINRFADQMNTAFRPGRTLDILEQVKAMVEPEIAGHIERFNIPGSLHTWNSAIDRMKAFGQQRPAYQRQHIVDYFGLDGWYSLSIDVNNPETGRVRVNTVFLSEETLGIDEDIYPWTGEYFRQIPVEIEAIPSPGYRFVRWEGLAGDQGPVITVIPSTDVEIAAVFEQIGPHDLAEGAYRFSTWSPDEPAGRYPPHIRFFQTNMQDPTLQDEIDALWTLPYDRDSRSRIVGLGQEGFAFINTGNPQDDGGGYLGAAVLSLSTVGQQEIDVTWTGGTVLPNSRAYNIRLQYRVGDSGPFADLLDAAGDPAEYLRHSQKGHVEVIGPVRLPEPAEDRELVELRWKYYYSGFREDPNSGQRSMLRIGDIAVASKTAPASPALAIQTQPSAAQSGAIPPSPLMLASLDGSGFTGPVTLTLEGGDGYLEGTLTVFAQDGIVLFDDLILHGAGEFWLRAEAPGHEPSAIGPIRVVRVSEVIFPKHIQGEQPENNNRVPFAYRLRIEGLLPHAAYRYGNRVVVAEDSADQDGGGNMLFARDRNDFVRNTDSPRFRAGDHGSRHHVFITDADGVYTGWFVAEPTGNWRFQPGTDLRVRLLLNDGSDGEEIRHFLTPRSAARITAFGGGEGEGRAVFGEIQGRPGDFVFLYDNEAGTGRPIGGTVIEGTGAGADDRYADFYLHEVAGFTRRFGTIVPNQITGGIQRIEVRNLADAQPVAIYVFPEGYPGSHETTRANPPLWIDPGEPVQSGPAHPWESIDVNSPSIAGSSDHSAANGTYTIRASGSDIWGASDQFHYTYRTLSGDGSLTARVVSLENTHSWAKSGVMIRESLDADSRHFMTLITPGNGVSVHGRSSTGGNSFHNTISGNSAPIWLKVEREGDILRGHYSYDGANWTLIRERDDMPMGENVYVGIAVTSRNNSTLTESVVGSIAVESKGKGASSYRDWMKEAGFTATEIDDPLLGGPAADPDGDNIPNLLEYALEGDPVVPGQATLPYIAWDGPYPSLIFPRDPAKGGAAYVVEATDDPDDWSKVLYDSRLDSRENNHGSRMRIVDPRPAHLAPEGRRFLRLRVEPIN